MRTKCLAMVGFLLASFAAPALAQTGELAKDILTARAGGKLIVQSDAFASGQDLDERYTQNGGNVSPPLSWSKGPRGTRSYVVLAEDLGADRSNPVPHVHWLIYDIPLNVTKLQSKTPPEAKLNNGAMQGRTIGDTVGFIGPKPPAGQTKSYHFQVFALSKKLNLDPAGADRNAVIEAMRGAVLAEGDIVANYTGK